LAERRNQDRYSIDSLEYIALAGGNGGIVVDVSYGGLGVQTVAALQPRTTIDFSVMLPQHPAPINGSAEVMWVTPRCRAGLRLAEVPELARQNLAEWISTITTKQENVSESEGDQGSRMTTPGPSASAQPKPEVNEGTPATSASEDWDQVRSGQATAAVTPKSIVDTAGASYTPAAGDSVGPFALSEKAMETYTWQKGWVVYTLGRFESNRFLVLRLGRCSDLADELHSYLGEYEGFNFTPCVSEKRAFQKECELYHRLRPPKNKFHPSKPANTDWNCPVCSG